MKVESEHLVILAIICYIAFLSHPPPTFVTMVLDHPVGQLLVLVGVVYAYMKKPLVGLFLGIAYIVSSYPTLEYMDESKASKDKDTKEKEQPKSGAPKVDMAQIGKLAQMLGKGSKLPMQKGKDVTEKPPETQSVKPHVDPKVTEKFTSF
jgi:hypothetical protein